MPPVISARTLAQSLSAHMGETISLQGWVHHTRHLSAVDFLLLRDRSGVCQIVVELPEQRSLLATLPHESVVTVTGNVVANRQAPGGVEVHAPVIAPMVVPASDPPFELYRPALDVHLPTRLDHAAVSLRHPQAIAAQRLTAAAMRGFRETLDSYGFTEIQTPKLLETAPEGGANVFRVDYFGRDAFLAQSPQLYKQIMVGALERVYEVAPAFRAEPHDTSRHVSQYLSLDAELGFIADHQDVMAVLRDVIAGMIAAMHMVDAPGVVLPEVPAVIPQIHFRDALVLVGAPEDESDLAPEHERALGEWALQEHGSAWCFVTGYPMKKRPFYTHPQPSDPTWSNSFDLLCMGLEITTGGQRLHRYEDYLAAITAREMDPAPFAGYLEAFRTGMPPHGGFAIGLERMIKQIVGASNVREVMLFPRDMHRLAP
ncbi:MAG: aspartate--tRNA(Asn) ligase [Thermomicrobiales bacterium]|nr:aspartate--tRNA(Asn) ligase [Thermomicrobiales bacterium]